MSRLYQHMRDVIAIATMQVFIDIQRERLEELTLRLDITRVSK